MAMKYTKYGKNRYMFIILDDNENIIDIKKDNISNTNVIDEMHKLGIADCNRHYKGNSYDAHLLRVWSNDIKEDLNKEGFGLYNSSGYSADFNNEIKVKYVVIDMFQKDKHTKDVVKYY